jgi:hypothetical protein
MMYNFFIEKEHGNAGLLFEVIHGGV